MSVNQTYLEDNSSVSDHPELGLKRLSSQEKYTEAPGSEHSLPKFESRNGNLPCMESQSPPKIYSWPGEYVENDFITNGRHADIQSASEGQLEKNLEAIAYQLWAVSNGSNGYEENSAVMDQLTLYDISLEYRQFYFETTPENYDFAMNIMAYIEFLNDSTWNATISHLDENVKRVVRCVWNEKKGGVANSINLHNFHNGLFLRLMADFTEWSLNRKYEFGEFMNYCVIMCQLGVIARISGLKNAPIFVIRQLRDRIKLFRFRDFVPIIFEFVVTEYSRKLVEYLRV